MCARKLISMAKYSSSGSTASIGCAACSAGLRWRIASTKASVAAMRFSSSEPEPPVRARTGYMSFHSGNFCMRGSAAIMRCSLVVPERGSPRIVIGPEICSSAMRGLLTNSSLSSSRLDRTRIRLARFEATPSFGQPGLVVERLHQSPQRLARIGGAEFGKPGCTLTCDDQLVGIEPRRVAAASGEPLTSTPFPRSARHPAATSRARRLRR